MKATLDLGATYLPAVVIEELLRRATTSERPVVESLAVSAGLYWRCQVGSCKAVTAVDPWSPMAGRCHQCRSWR